MSYGNGMISAAMARLRRAAFWWWGGIGCRVSFFMTVALMLVAALVGVFFFREGKKALEAEIGSRALYVAKELAALTAENIVTGNRNELYKKISSPFTANDDSLSGSTLLYLMIYNHRREMLIGRTAKEVFSDHDSHYYELPSGTSIAHDDIALRWEPELGTAPVFDSKKNGVYDLTLPILTGHTVVGFIRVGISGQWYQQQFSKIVKMSAVVLLGILLIGMAFSQIIALSITKPIDRLSEAADKLSRQNWDTTLPIQGTDELSKLGHAFNQMALALKSREASLSQGNRDLFLLHTAGLDLMESLEVTALLPKIWARAEDLVRADTIAISQVDSSDHMLKYLGVFGTRSHVMQDLDLPLESGGIYNWFVSYGTPLLLPEAQSDFRLDGEQMKGLGIKSLMAVPLWSANTMIGILTAINKKGNGNFDKYDLRLFTVYSSLAAAALQNASFYHDLNKNMNELKTAQEQLVQSTKMAAIGELSANIAHEINNPLTSVLGYTTHLLKTLDLPETPRRILGLMEQETLRVRKIIRNLLDFARQRPTWMQLGDISQPLRETVALVQGMADKASVVIHEDYPMAPILVNMDHNEMKQVFINLLNNAIQSMPHGGDLRIRLKVPRDHEAVIEVADSGSGIIPENLTKIFEPFFTTKETGDGTGLGLSISYRIVRNHGGKIEAQSQIGSGTVFRVILPVYENPTVV